MKKYKIFSIYITSIVLFTIVTLLINKATFYEYFVFIPLSFLLSIVPFRIFHRTTGKYDTQIKTETYTINYHSDRNNYLSTKIEMVIMSNYELESYGTNYPFTEILYFNNLTDVNTFLKGVKTINDLYYKCYKLDIKFMDKLDFYINRDKEYLKFKNYIKNKIRLDKLKNVLN
jgi:hypothetical protein